MIEGLWSVHFKSQNGEGAGVVVFETGRILGGDSNFIYLGQYNVIEKIVYMSGEIRHYAFNTSSIFGDLPVGGRLPLKVEAHFIGKESLRGEMLETNANNVIAVFNFRKVAELP